MAARKLDRVIHTMWKGGRKTRRGQPLPPEERQDPEPVTIIPRDKAGRYFGTLDAKRLRAHLRNLRERGYLICEKGRLQNQVRIEDPSAKYGVRHERCYVIRGTRQSEHPKAPSRAPVILWD